MNLRKRMNVVRYPCVVCLPTGESYIIDLVENNITVLNIVGYTRWSDWQTWSQCSNSCGSGTRKRLRVCEYSLSANVGHTCSGSELVYGPCFVKHCPGTLLLAPFILSFTNQAPRHSRRQILKLSSYVYHNYYDIFDRFLYELTDRNSTKTGHMLGSAVRFENASPKFGVSPPFKIENSKLPIFLLSTFFNDLTT